MNRANLLRAGEPHDALARAGREVADIHRLLGTPGDPAVVVTP